MIRIALLAWAGVSLLWSTQVPNPALNYVAALFDVAAAAAVDFLNTRWHQWRAA